MSRQLRIEYPGATYHVMSRGIDRLQVFRDNKDRMQFLELLAKPVQFGKLEIHSYALMSTHFHLLCETPFGELHRYMKSILGCYTTQFNLRYGRTGRLWEGRFRAILVGPGFYFLDCSRYIHLNPCKAGIVEHPADYFWSSFRNYAGLSNPAPWVRLDRLRGYFPKPRDYLTYVETGMRIPPVDPHEVAQLGIVYGDDRFIRELKEMVAHFSPDPEVPAIEKLLKFGSGFTPDRILQSVERAAPDCSRAERVRLYAYCLMRFTHLTNKAVAELVDRSPSSIGRIRARLDRLCESSREWKRRLTQVERALNASRGFSKS